MRAMHRLKQLGSQAIQELLSSSQVLGCFPVLVIYYPQAG